MLLLALLTGWQTSLVDYANAFVQATLDNPVWIHLPRGFVSKQPGKRCLQLVKSLYGLSASPLLCSRHLFSALKDMGFQVSKIDRCVFFKERMIVAFHVDDGLLIYQAKSDLNWFVTEFEKRDSALSIEGTLADFLGV
jgi:hypothetical protein